MRRAMDRASRAHARLRRAWRIHRRRRQNRDDNPMRRRVRPDRARATVAAATAANMPDDCHARSSERGQTRSADASLEHVGVAFEPRHAPSFASRQRSRGAATSHRPGSHKNDFIFILMSKSACESRMRNFQKTPRHVISAASRPSRLDFRLTESPLSRCGNGYVVITTMPSILQAFIARFEVPDRPPRAIASGSYAERLIDPYPRHAFSDLAASQHWNFCTAKSALYSFQR